MEFTPQQKESSTWCSSSSPKEVSTNCFSPREDPSHSSTSFTCTNFSLVTWSRMRQTLGGLKYLASHSIIHRDLALRNLLVSRELDGRYTVKVGDFGMSRNSGTEYVKDSQLIPIKWSAPEVGKRWSSYLQVQFITQGRSSQKSDVWSFGVCLWETFSLGNLPYPGMSNQEVVEKVASGYRMSPPTDCPAEIYAIMLSCWKSEADQRPTFEELFDKINKFCTQYAAQPTPFSSESNVVAVNDIQLTSYGTTTTVPIAYQ